MTNTSRRFVTMLVILIAAIASDNLAHAQKIDIEEAVLGQYGSLAPDRLSQLQWVTETGGWSYVEEKTLRMFNKSGREQLVLTLDELNKQAGTELRAFPQVTWLDAGLFRFRAGKVWYDFDFKKKRATQKFEVEKGSHFTFSDGHDRLAFTVENNVFIHTGEQVVQVTDHEEGIVAGDAIARSEFGISGGLFWAPDGRALAFYEKDERHVTEYPLIDYTETPAKYTPIRYPMAGDHSEYASLGVYNLKTRSTIYLNVNNGVKDDSYYITNVAWTPDNEKIMAAIVTRDQRTMQLIEFDAKSGQQLRLLVTETDDRYVEPEHPPIFIPDGSGRFLWFSERDGFNNLYLYGGDGKFAGRTMANFPITEFLGFGPKNRYAVVAAHGETPTERHIYRVNFPDMKMERVTRSPGTHRAKLSHDGTKFIDEWSSLTTPLQTAIVQVGGKIERLLLVSDNPLEGRTIGQTELGSLKADDGTDLHYRLITPPGMDKRRRHPVLVYVYNGPHVQLVTNSWMAGAPLWMHSLAAEGFVVFTIDGRGSNNRGKDFEQVIHRQLGQTEMADQMKGVEFLKSLPYVDDSRMAIHGWSYGGFMTTSMMLHHPEVFKVGIAGGPVIDWRLYEVMYTERYMDTPQDNSEGFSSARLTDVIGQLRGDLLMIHGADDDVVVLQHNMNFIKAAVDEGVLIDFFVYPGHAHNVRGKDRVHLMKKIFDYLFERI